MTFEKEWAELRTFEGDRISGTVDVSVKWSALSLGMMDSSENSRTWRRANESVYVQPDPGPAQTRLVAEFAVPGTTASQPSDPPLQFDVAGASPGTELRWKLLSTFAHSVTKEMGWAKTPVIPSALPPSA